MLDPQDVLNGEDIEMLLHAFQEGRTFEEAANFAALHDYPKAAVEAAKLWNSWNGKDPADDPVSKAQGHGVCSRNAGGELIDAPQPAAHASNPPRRIGGVTR
jgi:hypothetical protein